MAKPRGRKRTVAGLSDKTAQNLPKIETDEMRQARAFYLSLPSKQRTLEAVAKEFVCDHDKIWRWSRAFNWLEDAQSRDAAIIDPFAEKYQTEIELFRAKALTIACKHLDNECVRLGIENAMPANIQEKINSGDLNGASEEVIGLIKNFPIKAKDYKDISNLVDLIRKIVFEWNPNQMPKQPSGGSKSLEFNSYNLIIERANPTGRSTGALPMTGGSQ